MEPVTHEKELVPVRLAHRRLLGAVVVSSSVFQYVVV